MTGTETQVSWHATSLTVHVIYVSLSNQSFPLAITYYGRPMK